MCSQLCFSFDESRGHFDKVGTKREDVSTKVSILHLSKQDYKVVCENVIKRAFQRGKRSPEDGWMRISAPPPGQQPDIGREKKPKRENKFQKVEHDPLNRLSVPPRGLRDIGGTKKLKAAFIRVFILLLFRKANAA